MDWLPNFNQSNIVIALRAALAAAAILYVLEIYDIKNGMGHLGFLAVVLSCFAKPSALGDIFPFALLLIKGLIVTVPLMTGFVVFMRGQDQKSRSAFNFALPIVTFVGSFFITWTPWVPRPTRPVQCTLFYISIETARRGVDVYGPLRLAATVGIGVAFAGASCLVPLPRIALATQRLKDALTKARCLDASTVRSLADAICRIEKDQTCMDDLARARHFACQRGTVSAAVNKGLMPATMELLLTARCAGAKAAKAEVAQHNARTAPLRAMIRAAENRPSGVKAGATGWSDLSPPWPATARRVPWAPATATRRRSRTAAVSACAFCRLRPIGATIARQIPVLKVTRSNRVSVTG